MVNKAVVIGAGISGLLTARVLSEHFDEVVLVERDSQKTDISHRKGVPQGQHGHVLWSGGMDIIHHYFPDLSEELKSYGGLVYDSSKAMRWFHHGVWKARIDSGLKIHAQSRPLLEHCIRKSVLDLPNICYLDGHTLHSVRLDEQANHVTGVLLNDSANDEQPKVFDSELLVDCSGRTGAVIHALSDCGLPKPGVDTVSIDIGYATRIYSPPEDEVRDWKAMVIYPKAPDTYLWGVIFPIENGNWMVTLTGVHGHYLKSDDPDDFLNFAANLDRPELHGLISRATALTPVKRIRFPTQQRRRVKDWKSAPGGFVAVGDSICSLNPLYGQGMTVCAQEAALLDACLKKRGARKLDERFVMDYFNRASSVVDTAWLLATSSDFLYPETAGKRPALSKVASWYLSRMLRASGNSPTVFLRFLEVLHFVKPLPSILAPAVLLRVLFSRDPGPAS
jgi:2-polyprenyl-6-methoxyphenol hydroxylase-like FAD-dependent oxidoreductase